ncbi:hypothetical protein [Lentzea sp. NPDC051838]|uniref:vWA-MoxR associated conflict system protein n=1 Tax=Lentzea sp. NPDC051838 TaxID=3154849 RepID=UPI003442609D
MTVRRHVLIVAVQYDHDPTLTSLIVQAADELRSVLTDSTLGACRPGLPDGSELLTAKCLTADDIRIGIRAAIEHANDHDATLVLAILGHGFVTGSDPTLYLMASQSEPGLRASAVNVRELLIEAADMPRVNGVIAIIDTCTAVAAAPDLGRLAAGIRTGKTRCNLLMASALHQEAFNLRLSRQVASVLRVGIRGAGPTLSPSSILGRVREKLVGQDTVSVTYDGDSLAEEHLWLAHNRRHGVIRPVHGDDPAAGQLGELLLELRLPVELARDRSSSGLDELRRQLEVQEWSVEKELALKTIDNLDVATRTTMYLRGNLAHALSQATLRRAAHIARLPALPMHLANDAAVLDHLALSHPTTEPDCRQQLARFVTALIVESGGELGDVRLQAWADSVDAISELNTALESMRDRHASRRLRLIISLHASVAGDWPETVSAWLLRDGERYQQDEFTCLPDREGVEAALVDAMDWAVEHAEDLDLDLRHVDVALPTALLVRWRPEEVHYHQKLGLDFLVSTRWSDRLKPNRMMVRAINHASRRLAELDAGSPDSPVDWLDGPVLGDLIQLRDNLANGRYGRALGLGRRPRAREGLLDLLLMHSPILLWPQTVDEFPPDLRDSVTKCWHLLPDELLYSYRLRWGSGTSGGIADLRAVWDDEEWLGFCRRIQPRTAKRGSN